MHLLFYLFYSSCISPLVVWMSCPLALLYSFCRQSDSLNIHLIGFACSSRHSPSSDLSVFPAGACLDTCSPQNRGRCPLLLPPPPTHTHLPPNLRALVTLQPAVLTHFQTLLCCSTFHHACCVLFTLKLRGAAVRGAR